MSKIVWAVLVGSVTLLSGCGGGGGGGSAPVLPEPPDEPTLQQDITFDCGRAAPEKQSDTAAQPGGIYFGTLYDCASGTTLSTVTLVSVDGRFYIMPWEPQSHQLAGTITVDGDTFQGSGLEFGATDQTDLTDLVTTLHVDGGEGSQNQLAGRWTTEYGGYGTFRTESPRSLRDWGWDPPPEPPAERWLATTWEGLFGPTGAQLMLTVGESGELNGTDTAGCLYNGQFAVIDPQYALFDVTLSITDCALTGVYSGLSFWIPWGLMEPPPPGDGSERRQRGSRTSRFCRRSRRAGPFTRRRRVA